MNRQDPSRNQGRGNSSSIDMGPNSPQISARVWKSPDWRGFANAFPFAVGGFFLFVGIMVLGNRQDAPMAPLFFVVALLLFVTHIPLRMLGKGEYRLGFDRNKDILWVYRKGKGITGIEHDAHKITGFSFVDKRSFSLNHLWYMNPSMPFLWHKREWLLSVGRTTSQFQFGVAGSGLAIKSEAMEVAEKANGLLRAMQPNQSRTRH